MRLLLDTHVFLWAADMTERLSPASRTAIESASNEVFVSSASAWEIAIKARLGQLRFAVESLESVIDRLGFTTLVIAVDHALAAGTLPLHHRDPFDRMLVAQARLEGMTLATADKVLARYDVPILRA